jgi:hypothetical protein
VSWAAGVRAGASGFPAVLGVVALIVAVSGRISPAIKLRYAGERLPAVPAFVPGPSGPGPRRRMVRRTPDRAHCGPGPRRRADDVARRPAQFARLFRPVVGTKFE